VPFGDFFQHIDDFVTVFLIERYELTRLREACPSGCRIVAAVLAAQESSGQRAPDQNADVVVLGKGLEFVLKSPADEAVVHLCRHILFKAETFLKHNCRRSLP